MLDMQVAVNELFDQMHTAIKGNPEAQRISDKIEVLVRAHCFPETSVGWVDTYRMTGLESRICETLHAHMGKVMRRSHLYDALYFDKIGDTPEDKIIDVYICKIRKKLKDSPYAIDAIWGLGYRMKERVAA